LESVGAGDDHDVGVDAVAGGFSGADAASEGVDQLLTLEVAAAFGLDLVFDAEGCDAATRVLLDCHYWAWGDDEYGIRGGIEERW
jgi:hypothetical protein